MFAPDLLCDPVFKCIRSFKCIFPFKCIYSFKCICPARKITAKAIANTNDTSHIRRLQVSSCTSDENVARGFARGCGSKATMLTIETTTACEISALSVYSNEKESLLAPGTQLKVISSTKSGNIAEIKLKEVGRLVG